MLHHIRHSTVVVATAIVGFTAALPAHAAPQVTVTQLTQLFDPASEAGDQFGYTVALSGRTAVVGQNRDSTMAAGDSAAHVLVQDAGSWVYEAKLSLNGVNVPGPTGATGTGRAIAIDGNTAVVGKPWGRPVGDSAGPGQVQVFVRTGATWQLQATLHGFGAVDADCFGQAVAISGNTLAIGALRSGSDPFSLQGWIYVYVRSGSTWTLQQLLTDGNLDALRLGSAVALEGDTLVAGSPFAQGLFGPSQGSASVYVRSGTTWSLQAKFFSADTHVGEAFGVSVALSGDTLLVGAPAKSDLNTSSHGAAYVFVRDGTTWSQQARLNPTDPQHLGLSGQSCDLQGDTAVIGAPGKHEQFPTVFNAGAAYLFTRCGSAWTPKKITATPNIADSRFGTSVALEGDTLLVGAIGHQQSRGAVYVLRVEPGSLGTRFCFGDGSIGTPCPCSPPNTVPNPSGAMGSGCANPFNAHGAQLSACGSTTPDTVRFSAWISPNYTAFAFAVKGNAQVATGIANADGLQCVSGTLVRFGGHFAGTGGVPAGMWTYPNEVQTLPVSTITSQAPAQSAFYQLVYRSSLPNFCGPGTTNWSNALQVDWN